MSKVILSLRSPNLINNSLTTIAGESALDAAMGKTLQDSIDNKHNLEAERNNEMNICYNILPANGTAYLNYRGASLPINEVRMCNGMITGDMATVRAKDFYCASTYDANRDVYLSKMPPVIIFNRDNGYTGSSVQLLKDKWVETVTGLNDGIYPCIIKNGSITTGIIQTTSLNGPTYGAVLLIGYNYRDAPFYMILLDGVWSK